MFLKKRLVNSEHLSIEPGPLKWVAKIARGDVTEFKLTYYSRASLIPCRNLIRELGYDIAKNSVGCSGATPMNHRGIFG